VIKFRESNILKRIYVHFNLKTNLLYVSRPMNDKPRKRGRPPKPNGKPIIHSGKKKDTENIVLFLALTESDSDTNHNSEANNFTVNDTEFDGISRLSNITKSEKQTDITVNKKSNILSITDSDNDSDSSDDFLTKQTFNPQILIEEIKKRDTIIHNLKNKIGNTNLTNNTNVNYHSTIVADIDSMVVFKPHPTDIHCWWCDHQFTTIPIYIPSSYKNGVYYVFGNFCSFNCAGRYNFQMLNDYKCATRNALLHNLKEKMTGVSEKIRFAPMRELLNSKGGTMTIEEFRRGFLKLNLDKLLSMPPLIPMIHTVENVGREI